MYARTNVAFEFKIIENPQLVSQEGHYVNYKFRYVVRVIYKEIWVPIMMIEHSIYARSDAILSDQNACFLSYNIIKEGLAKILQDHDDRANKFCSIRPKKKICLFAKIRPMNFFFRPPGGEKYQLSIFS